MTTLAAALQSACPECDARVPFDRPPLRGEIASCRDCGVELEVIALDPVALEVAPEVEEDWGE